MISRTRSRIATSNPSRREPSWPTSLTMLAFAMAYSSCALNLQSRDSGLSPLLTSQENTPSLFLQESGRSPDGRAQCVGRCVAALPQPFDRVRRRDPNWEDSEGPQPSGRVMPQPRSGTELEEFGQ